MRRVWGRVPAGGCEARLTTLLLHCRGVFSSVLTEGKIREAVDLLSNLRSVSPHREQENVQDESGEMLERFLINYGAHLLTGVFNFSGRRTELMQSKR